MKTRCMRISSAILVAQMLMLLASSAFAMTADTFRFYYYKPGDPTVITGYDGIVPEWLHIPYGTTAIADGVFDHCQGITKITFPSTLRSIGDKAFFECSNLEQILLPDSLETVGSQAFAYCSGVDFIEMWPGVQSFASDALLGDLNIEMIFFWGTRAEWEASNVTLPEGSDIAIVGEDFSINYDPWHHTVQQTQPEISIASAPLGGTERLSLTLGQNELVPSDPLVLSGITASVSEANAVTVGTLLGNLSSRGYLQVQHGDPGWLIRHIILATGDTLVLSQLPDGVDPLKQATILVKGDVLGTGLLDIAQITRAAQALTGSDPLEGIYLAAADFNNNGAVDVGDLAGMARLLNAGMR